MRLLLLFALPASVFALDPPVVTKYEAGSTVIQGRTIPQQAPVRFEILVCNPIKNDVDCQKESQFHPADLRKEAVDSLRGDFVVELAHPLRAGQVFKIRQTVRGEAQSSEHYEVSDPDADEDWIDFSAELPIREGREKISGSVGTAVTRVRVSVRTPAGPEAKSAGTTCGGPCPNVNTTGQTSEEMGREFYMARVKEALNRAGKIDDSVLSAADNKACVAGEVEQVMDVAVDKGKFQTAFARPIEAGQCVLVRRLKKDGSTVDVGEVAQVPDPAIVVPSYLDWGRFRGTFALGTVFGNSNGSIKTDPYVGFRADMAIVSRLLRKKSKTGGDLDSLFALRDKRLGLHFFTEGRVTQASQLDAKAAVQTQALTWHSGLYAPISLNGMDWTYKGSVYSFFFAPVIKYGVTWLRDGIPDRAVTTTIPADTGVNTGVSIASSSKTDPTPMQQSAPFYAYGTRLGFHRYDKFGTLLRNRQIFSRPAIFMDTDL
jgi:hypothetical protein